MLNGDRPIRRMIVVSAYSGNRTRPATAAILACKGLVRIFRASGTPHRIVTQVTATINATRMIDWTKLIKDSTAEATTLDQGMLKRINVPPTATTGEMRTVLTPLRCRVRLGRTAVCAAVNACLV